LGASFVFSKKINSEDRTMPLRGKYACVEGSGVIEYLYVYKLLFIFRNGSNMIARPK